MTVFFLICLAPPSQAEQTVLSGGATLRQEYDSNIYRTNRDRVSEWTTSFSPSLALVDSGQHHSLFLEYSPSVVYSQLTDSERWDHQVAALLERELTKRLTFHVRDTFIRAEDPYNDADVGIELSDSRGRNRYWTNNATAGLDYAYAKESFLKLSYANLILDNKDDTVDDYVKHTSGVSLQHQFTPHWQTELNYFFTKGNFELEDDLETHAGDAYLSFHPSAQGKIFVHGGYTATRYVGLQEDYDLIRGSVGFAHQFSSTFDWGVEGGVVTMDRDVSEDQDTFYYQGELNKKFQHGLLSFSGEGGVDDQQFDGTSERDLSRYWQVAGEFEYKLAESLTANLGCTYRQDKYWERTPEEKEDELLAEASLSYAFGRWYTARLWYAYSRRDADNESRCYDDNRVFLELGFNKEFFKW